MDPLHVFAARQVTPARTSEADDIDAFYDANALEILHGIRRGFGCLLRRLRDAGIRFGRKAPAAQGIARAAGPA